MRLDARRTDAGRTDVRLQVYVVEGGVVLLDNDILGLHLSIFQAKR